MKQLILALFPAIFIFSEACCQANYYNAINMGQQGLVNNAVIADSIFIVACQLNGDFGVMKATNKGQPLWVRTCGSGNATGVIADYNNSIIACGNISGFAVVAFNQNSDTLWTFELNDSLNPSQSTSLIQLADSSYLVEGMDGPNVIIVRLAKTGAPLFAYTLNAAINVGSVVATADGGFVSSNANNPALADSMNFMLSRFDSSGTLLWAKEYAMNSTQAKFAVSAITTTADKGFILGGSTTDSIDGAQIQSFMLARVDSAGNIEWSGTYLDSASASYASLSSVIENQDGSFAACGSIAGDSGYNIISFKTDNSGNFLWAKSYNAFLYNYGVSVTAYQQGYTLFGTGYNTPSATLNTEIISADSNGNVSCNISAVNLSAVQVTLKASSSTFTDTAFTGFGYAPVQLSFANVGVDTICYPIPYFPMLEDVNIWHNIGNFIFETLPPNSNNGIRSSLGGNCSYYSFYPILFTASDTAINGLTYKQLYASNLDYYYGYGGDTCLFGFIREDTLARKVYFMGSMDSSETLIYDFSMLIGDSTQINFNHGEGYFQTGMYKVDSIKNIAIQAGIRREYFLNCETCSPGYNYYGPITLTWIESVGNLGATIYPYSLNQRGGAEFCSGPPPQFCQFVSCFEHSQKVYFDSCNYAVAVQDYAQEPECYELLDSCDYGPTCGGIHTIADPLTFTVYPNPTSNEVTLNFTVNKSDNFDIAILDIQGRRAQVGYI